MKVHIDKQLKIRLLNAIQEGVFDSEKFPELAASIIEWNEVRTYENQERMLKGMTKEQIAEILADEDLEQT